ncbi:MAG: hypothetical protein QOD06_2123 [Candidatus Binatota bacterium]|nr:hypothetical protein [Candidatus Binatota bacterium]
MPVERVTEGTVLDRGAHRGIVDLVGLIDSVSMMHDVRIAWPLRKISGPSGCRQYSQTFGSK